MLLKFGTHGFILSSQQACRQKYDSQTPTKLDMTPLVIENNYATKPEAWVAPSYRRFSLQRH